MPWSRQLKFNKKKKKKKRWWKLQETYQLKANGMSVILIGVTLNKYNESMQGITIF